MLKAESLFLVHSEPSHLPLFYFVLLILYLVVNASIICVVITFLQIRGGHRRHS